MLGGLIGAVVGGVIGFFVGGGPVGAFYGASLGFALGMVVDPMAADMPFIGAPDQDEIFMTSEIGTPILDLAGTAKITGHLLCYGKETTHSLTQNETTTHTYYYMSWAVGIVMGPIDTIYAVYKGDDVVWEGKLNVPASGGQETIILKGMGHWGALGGKAGWPATPRADGNAKFYFGTDDQVANSDVGEILGDATLNSPYKHLCWCFFDNCYIGEYNRCPTMKFIVKKIPENAFSTTHEIQKYDCNPAHVMWYILHDLVGLPESWLHSVDFAALALTLFNENRGMSVLFDRQQSALNYLESINSHIDNILRYGTDGKFHPKLIRDDYTVGDLPLIDEDVMLDEPTFNRKSWIDTVNEMKVQYTEILAERLESYALYFTGLDYHNAAGFDPSFYNYYEFTAHPIPMTNVVKVEGGYNFAMILKDDGTIWGAGYNVNGALGSGFFDTSYPYNSTGYTQEVLEDIDWVDVWCGWAHTLALKSDGTLWATGHNGEGYLGLGLGDYTSRHTFTQIGTATNWVTCGCGYVNSYAINEDGELWGWGNNGNGELGQGTTTEGDWRCIPVRIGTDTDWAAVTSGDAYGMFLKSDGRLYGCGFNMFGELGIDNFTTKISTLTQVHDTDGITGEDWASVGTFYDTTMAIKKDGTLWATGLNDCHQCGIGENGYTNLKVFTQVGTDTDWSRIEAGVYFMIIRKSNGKLYGTGYDYGGTFGRDYSDPPFEDILDTPQIVGADEDEFTDVFSCIYGATMANKIT